MARYLSVVEGANAMGVTYESARRWKNNFTFFTADGRIDTATPEWDECVGYKLMGLDMKGRELKGGATKKKKTINAADYLGTSQEHSITTRNPIDTSPAIPEKQKGVQERIHEGKAKKLETEHAKAELELRLRQDELVEKEVLGELVFGYLEALSNSMLSMPDGIIDNIIATVQATGRESRPRVVDLLAGEISKVLEKSVKEQKVLFKKKRPCPLNSAAWFLEKLDCLTVEKVTITVSEWAEQKRILPEGTPFPGFWRNEKTPFLVEIMDELSPSSATNTVTIMKSVQMGLTAVAENFIGYILDANPGHILYITATQDLAEDWARKRLDPMIDLCGMGHKLRAETTHSARGRKASGDRALSKSFAGGSFNATSYNVAAMLRSNSFRYLIMDEVDAAPVSTKREGDPITIAKARTSAFEGRSKVLIFSTPLTKQTSKVWASFKEGDQSYQHVPCPHCGEYQKLIWRDDDGAHRLHYDVKDGIVQSDSVYYECKECSGKIKNYHKDEILPKGKWIAENLNCMPGHRSFHISGLYAPLGMTSWETLAQEWETSKGDNEKLKAFINLRLGEPWVDGVEFVDDEEALAKRQHYVKGSLPEGVEFCTMGCDVHGDNIQLEVVGYGGEGNHKWSIDYKKLEGSTLDPHSGAFYKLRNYIEKNVKRYNVKMVFIDAGYTTNNVLKFCSAGTSIVPIMGEGLIDRGRALFKVRESKTTVGTSFVGIATDSYKEIIMKSLKLRHSIEGNFPYGFPFFPIDYDVKYFRGLNSEIKQPILNQGRLVRYQWTKIREHNHPLDCRVYALCAKDFFFKRICESYEVDIIDEDIAWAAVRNGKF